MKGILLLFALTLFISYSLGRRPGREGLQSFRSNPKIDFIQRKPTTVFRASDRNSFKYSPYSDILRDYDKDDSYPQSIEELWDSTSGEDTTIARGVPQSLFSGDPPKAPSSFMNTPSNYLNTSTYIPPKNSAGEKYKWSSVANSMLLMNPKVVASKPQAKTWANDLVESIFDKHPLAEQKNQDPSDSKVTKVIQRSTFNKTYYDVVPHLWNSNPKYTEVSEAIIDQWGRSQPPFINQLSLTPSDIYSVKEYENLNYINIIVKFMVKHEQRGEVDPFYPYRGPSYLNVTCDTNRYYGPKYNTPEVRCELDPFPNWYRCKNEEVSPYLAQIKAAAFESLLNKSIDTRPSSVCFKEEGESKRWLIKYKTGFEKIEVVELTETMGQYNLIETRPENREKYLVVNQIQQAKLIEELLKPAIELHMNGLLKTKAKTYKVIQIYNILEKFMPFGKQYKVTLEVSEFENYVNQERKQVSFESSRGDLGCFIFSNEAIGVPERDPGLFFFSSQLREKLMVNCDRIPKHTEPLGVFNFVTSETSESVLPKLEPSTINNGV